MISFSLRKSSLPLTASIVAAVIMIASLRGQGRLWWCKLGDLRIYVPEAWNSSHTSQHLFDPYSFTHVLHGVLFFWVTGALLSKFSVSWRFAIAMTAECAWELLENSNFIIEKYRENTASLDYFGDSVMNSLGDVIACAVGFALAVRLGWIRSLLFFVAVELLLMFWIRDGLLLNIVMLIRPIDAVKNWQMGI